MVKQILEKEEKREISRRILTALPEWFGIEKAREAYIADSAKQVFFAAHKSGEAVGFLCLKETGRDTMEIAVMGVLPSYHRQGVGRELVEAAKEYAYRKQYSFVQVKTVQMGRYSCYDDTNRFYLSQGFLEFEVFPALWDEWNPCQIYIMYLAPQNFS
jgi:GNAT superfamily N-acetyltransferase